MKKPNDKGVSSWAYLRFSIIGGLLTNPPKKGELKAELESLAKKRYRHPSQDALVTFGVSTLERWYYQALKSDDPILALGRKIRSDSGINRSMSHQLFKELKAQYLSYPHWSYQLHADNLEASIMERSSLEDIPSYSTVLRRMKKHGWIKKRSSSKFKTKGQIKALDRLDQREVRSFEASHVHALWHLDFHHGRRVVDVHGTWHTPKVLCILDDRSRLCCHIQWYLDETAETLIHGMTQAFHKRGLPRSLMTDNGSAMIASEVQNGFIRLGIKHDKTLPYSPYQNGKQESFWGQLEGRLMAMLSNVDLLTLEFLNKATQAWAETEYNRSVHTETTQKPLERMLNGPDVSRSSPDTQTLNFYFLVTEKRIQRFSDGTIQIKGVRFEIPSAFRHINRLKVGYKVFDLSMAYLIDERTGDNLARIYPQDKTKNAKAIRRTLEPVSKDHCSADLSKTEAIPPLLRKLLADYAATGLPPAYLPREERLIDTNSNLKGDN